MNRAARSQLWRPRLGRGWAVLALTLYWSSLFVGTHLPPKHVQGTRVSDKWLHFLAYAGLAFLTALIFATLTTRSASRWLTILVLLALYAAVDEFTQMYVGRSAEWADWVADLAGIVAGLAMCAVARALVAMLRPKSRLPSP